MVFVDNLYGGRTRQPAPLFWWNQVITGHTYIVHSSVCGGKEKTQDTMLDIQQCYVYIQFVWTSQEYTHVDLYTKGRVCDVEVHLPSNNGCHLLNLQHPSPGWYVYTCTCMCVHTLAYVCKYAHVHVHISIDISDLETVSSDSWRMLVVIYRILAYTSRNCLNPRGEPLRWSELRGIIFIVQYIAHSAYIVLLEHTSVVYILVVYKVSRRSSNSNKYVAYGDCHYVMCQPHLGVSLRLKI